MLGEGPFSRWRFPGPDEEEALPNRAGRSSVSVLFSSFLSDTITVDEDGRAFPAPTARREGGLYTQSYLRDITAIAGIQKPHNNDFDAQLSPGDDTRRSGNTFHVRAHHRPCRGSEPQHKQGFLMLSSSSIAPHEVF